MTAMLPGQDAAGRVADAKLAVLALAGCRQTGDEQGALAVWHGRDDAALGLAALWLLTDLLGELAAADVAEWIERKRAGLIAELAAL